MLPTCNIYFIALIDQNDEQQKIRNTNIKLMKIFLKKLFRIFYADHMNNTNISAHLIKMHRKVDCH